MAKSLHRICERQRERSERKNITGFKFFPVTADNIGDNDIDPKPVLTRTGKKRDRLSMGVSDLSYLIQKIDPLLTAPTNFP